MLLDLVVREEAAAAGGADPGRAEEASLLFCDAARLGVPALPVESRPRFRPDFGGIILVTAVIDDAVALLFSFSIRDSVVCPFFYLACVLQPV